MLTDKYFEASIMLLSFLVSVGAYLLIVWKDRSWINWATPFFFISVGTRYVFQFGYLLLVAAGGSRFAYFFCYSTYALSFLSMALAYTFIRPVRWRLSGSPQPSIRWLPWILLTIGVLLYLPVLIEFRAELANPRRIYELTRTGYGVWNYGSTTFVSLGFVTYLFKHNKSTLGSFIFYVACAASVYWHGSKGALVTFVLIYLLHRVYILRKPTGVVASVTLLGMTASVLIALFALFGNVADTVDLFQSVTSYADYVRNAMTVIDDPNGQRYYGRLTIENEIYSRVPRVLDSDKPKDFGPFILAKIYNPESYRNDEGVGDFSIGEYYADFGSFSLMLSCLFSLIMGWFAASMTSHLRLSPSAPAFIVLLFFAGINVIPISGTFFLPEALILAGLLSVALRLTLIGRGSRRGECRSGIQVEHQSQE